MHVVAAKQGRDCAPPPVFAKGTQGCGCVVGAGTGGHTCPMAHPGEDPGHVCASNPGQGPGYVRVGPPALPSDRPWWPYPLLFQPLAENHDYLTSPPPRPVGRNGTTRTLPTRPTTAAQTGPKRPPKHVNPGIKAILKGFADESTKRYSQNRRAGRTIAGSGAERSQTLTWSRCAPAVVTTIVLESQKRPYSTSHVRLSCPDRKSGSRLARRPAPTSRPV